MAIDLSGSGPIEAPSTSYDWLEDILGLDIHNADEIVPAWGSTWPLVMWCGQIAPAPAAGSSSGSSR